jgi:hypothetical protein
VNIRKVWLKAEARRQYWQTIPLSALAWLGLTTFLSFSSIGLGIHLGDGLQWPFGWVLAEAVFFGIVMALSLAAILRHSRARFTVLPLVVLVIGVLPRITPAGFPSNKTLMGPGFEHLRRRLAIEGMLSSMAAAA